MSGQQDQQVTVRLLPDGAPHAAILDKLSGQFLWLDLSPLPPGESLDSGDLVEVLCATTLYLGVLRTCHGTKMMIVIEHALDRETLAAIQEVWHGPSRRWS